MPPLHTPDSTAIRPSCDVRASGLQPRIHQFSISSQFSDSFFETVRTTREIDLLLNGPSLDVDGTARAARRLHPTFRTHTCVRITTLFSVRQHMVSLLILDQVLVWQAPIHSRECRKAKVPLWKEFHITLSKETSLKSKENQYLDLADLRSVPLWAI